jgi:gamma-glutamylputrescine oxidase
MSNSTYYQATATEPFPNAPSLTERVTADVCVIGGGYTGLSAALHLARQGASVRLLEASRIGDGASGRNGGQVHNGFRHDSQWFESRLGPDFTRQIGELAIESRAHLDWLIRTYNIDVQYQPGLLHLCHKKSYVAEARAHVDDVMNRHPEAGLRFVDLHEARSLVRSNDYYGGYLDSRSGHLHGLNLALGIARAANQHGALSILRLPASRETLQVGRSTRALRRSKPKMSSSRATATCATCNPLSKPGSCRSTTSS